tara:strand:- start:66 stop:464 length:399 start_codon:yes stop_codon:yes gene_type:complete
MTLFLNDFQQFRALVTSRLRINPLLNNLVRAWIPTTFALVIGSVEVPVHAAYLDGARPLLVACFSSTNATSCDQALVLIEAMQRRAADRELYPCQTLLLGLQAEVVMVQLAEQRGQKAFETLRDSERLCARL